MRLDHIAFRVADRLKTSQFFIDAFGYKKQAEFTIDFDDGTHAQCIALEPPEKILPNAPWEIYDPVNQSGKYHMPPEIFVSDGEPGSLIDVWVKERGGIGGVHHMAYQVESVQNTMEEWKQKGYAEFTSDDPWHCEGLTQVFTKPSILTGVIFEFIERGTHGFCQANVKNLMESTRS